MKAKRSSNGCVEMKSNLDKNTEFTNVSDCCSEDRVDVSDEDNEVDILSLDTVDGIFTSQNEEEDATEVLGEVNEDDISLLETEEGTCSSDSENKDTAEESIMKALLSLPPPACKMVPGSFDPDLDSIRPGRCWHFLRDGTKENSQFCARSSCGGFRL